MSFSTSLSPLIPLSSHPRDVQTAEIGAQTRVLRSRTWDRLKFEIEYGRRKGTTANSYLIRAERTALIDPPGESFSQQFLGELTQYLELPKLDYVILGHVNPNRIATLIPLFEQASQAQILCSRPAANALKSACPDWIPRIQVVRSETQLDLGQGHCLQFLPIPTPRWPDGLATYDPATHILFTDKLFAVHVCGNALFDEDWRQLEADRRYYFDCLHAPQAKQVESALAQFSTVQARCYAPAHGPLVRYSLSRFRADYEQWCQQRSRELQVALLYASAYGNTATIANALAHGLVAAGVSVESINCEFIEPDALSEVIARCDGFIIGSPTLGGHAPVQIQTALGVILANAIKTKLAGVFGSYGWSGEAVDLLEQKLRDANYQFGFDPIRVRFSPDEATLKTCEAAGAEFAQKLRKQKKQRAARQAVTETHTDRTAQAVGRIIGSICVMTTRQGETHRGLLTAWVSQASFSPPGIMVAIAADQLVDHLTQPGTSCVLNILKEGRNIRRHFSYYPAVGEDPFATLTYYETANGCRILDEALAYLECTVQHWMPCGDHWLFYATVDQGDILESSGVTAMSCRKSGCFY